jgi:hypothetical protein
MLKLPVGILNLSRILVFLRVVIHAGPFSNYSNPTKVQIRVHSTPDPGKRQEGNHRRSITSVNTVSETQEHGMYELSAHYVARN